MKDEQLVVCLEPIEQRYKQDYSTQERKMLYEQYFWMTTEMFGELCGLVVAADKYRIPAVDDFTKTQIAHPDKFRRRQKGHEPCKACKGMGVRRFLQRRPDGKHTAPAARCDCRNGENWPQFPSVKNLEGLPGFVRVLSCHESDFEAVTAADRAVDAETPGSDTEEEPEAEVDDNVPF